MKRKIEPANKCHGCGIVLSRNYHYELCPACKEAAELEEEEARIAAGVQI